MFNTTTYYGTDAVLTVSNVDPTALQESVVTGYLGDAQAVGRVTNVGLQVRIDIRPFHEMGRRLPSELRAGNIHISGSVERAYINGAMLRLMLGAYSQGQDTGNLKVPFFDMKLTLDNRSAPKEDQGVSTLTVFGVIFDQWNALFPEDDFMMEKLTFKALRIAVEDSEVENG